MNPGRLKILFDLTNHQKPSMPSYHCNPLVHSGGNQPTQHNSSEPVQGECYIGCNCASVLVLHVVLILVLYYVVVPTLVQYIWLHKLSCNSSTYSIGMSM